MNVITSFMIAMAMYSKIPMVRTNWSAEKMKYSLAFFPVVGLVIGGLQVIWFSIAHLLSFSQSFYAAIATVIPIMVTGGIHMDGYCDTVDALASFQPKEKRLAILKDSNAGAFAIIWTVLYFLVYYGAMTLVDSWQMILVISSGYMISRALSGIAVIYFPCANKKGTLAAFSSTAAKKIVQCILILVCIINAIVLLALHVILGVFVMLAVAVLFLNYYKKAMKEFGGITGDLAGWFTVKCELAVILTCTVMTAVLHVL